MCAHRPRAVAMGSPVLIVGLALAALLAGCGEGSSSTTGSTVAAVPSSPAAATRTAAASGGQAVAEVDGSPISKAAYAHWLTVERRGGATNAAHRALGFLLTAQWVLDEAAARHIAISEAQVKRRYEQLTRASFPKPKQLAAYLAKVGESEADLLARVKIELLTARIAARVTASQPAARHEAILAAFERSFHQHWQALTNCRPGYVMEDCRGYHGGSENLTAPSPSAAGASATGAHGARGGASGGTGSSAGASGEINSPTNGFSLTSSAFAPNSAIPTKYTCAGAGISPPLSWTHVPAHAAELFLFAIDLNANGKDGGIRWVVGGIDPSSSGVAEGRTPPGGIVGTNSAGEATYGAICPAPGKTDTIEFIMYALRKPISLSPGFQPSAAEGRYGGDLLGQPAVTYGTASR